MLIPSAFSQYDIVVDIDLDVLLPLNLPNIFLRCLLMPVFPLWWIRVKAMRSRRHGVLRIGLREGHRRYFENMGLSADIELLSVNGGVLAFRPGLLRTS